MYTRKLCAYQEVADTKKRVPNGSDEMGSSRHQENGRRRELVDANLYLTQIMFDRFLDLFQPFFHQFVLVHVPVPGNKKGKFLVLRLCPEVKLRGANAEHFPRFDGSYCWCRGYLWWGVLDPCIILSRRQRVVTAKGILRWSQGINL